MTHRTLPQLLLEKAEKEGRKVALRQKNLGIWKEWTWRDYYREVESLALGFQEEFSIQAGERIGIIGDNRPHWIVTELAAQSIGAVPVGIYQDAPPDAMAHYLRECDPRILVVEDQEQVDKLLEIIHSFPAIEAILFWNEKGLRSYSHDKLMDLKSLQSVGSTRASEDPSFFEHQIQKVKPLDIAFITFTSGVTRHPRAATFTHSNLIQTALSIHEVDPVKADDDYLSFLSLAWICEQVMAVGLSLTRGMTINFPEEPSTTLNDLREIGPHLIQAPPRTFENMLTRFQIRMNDSTKLKKKMFELTESGIEKNARAKLSNRSVSFLSKLKYSLDDFFMYSAIRDHLGLSRVRRAYVTGGRLNRDAFEFFQGLGVNVKQTYGMVETTGYASIQRDREWTAAGAGKPLPGLSMNLASRGEVQCEGLQVFAGYLGGNHVTELSTGDYGRILDSGEMEIRGRMEERLPLESTDGQSSSEIETELRKSHYLQEAVVFGEGRAYLTAMLTIHRASVGRWAEKNQISYTSYRDLTMHPEVIELIKDQVLKMMQSLPEESRIKRFVILPEELRLSDGEMTSTQKTVRRTVEKNYKRYLAALYNDAGQFDTLSNLNSEETYEGEIVPIILLDRSQGVA
ncbi:AMP-binding protein [Halobacillus sp. GSS1]|uniref:AMP-binding protein n=1 Tax=Halobacillus sp. GSS1 TaxID=2815919 RepID=UPI001A8C5816|nr:AMP-binding protein [Halobacillus sp. GSS1]MBN9655675.1 AMP-binding protein [Halobacillus sp. GSS1]